MTDKQDALAWSFQKVSKNDWLEKVRGDLKGRSYDELRWEINERLKIEPFYTLEKTPTSNEILSGRSGWCAVQSIKMQDSDQTNAAMLEALAQGAEGVWLDLHMAEDIKRLPAIMEGVHLGYINMYISTRFKITTELLQALSAELSKCEGSDEMQIFLWCKAEEVKNLMASAGPIHPIHFHWEWKNKEWSDLDISLGRMLLKVNKIIEKVSEEKRGQLIKKMHLSIALGDNYFLEIARLRALRSVMKNLLTAWGLPNENVPHILAMTDLNLYDKDPYQNMIRAASIAMSGAIGGADAVFIHPGDAVSEKELDFAPRISLNVQHLMKMESHIDKVQDPAAGSYYIETLTRKLGQSAWETFRTKA